MRVTFMRVAIVSCSIGAALPISFEIFGGNFEFVREAQARMEQARGESIVSKVDAFVSTHGGSVDDQPNMHEYINLDSFCMDSDYGNYAIGYKNVGPSSTIVICMHPEGLRVVTQAVVGSQFASTLIQDTDTDMEFTWAPRLRSTSSTLDDVFDRPCEDDRILGVVPTKGGINAHSTWISDGYAVCQDGDDIVFHGDGELLVFEDYEPYHGAPHWRAFRRISTD